MRAGFDQETEDLYMPSRWVQRMSGDAALLEYARWTKNESDKARALPSARLGIQAGEGKVDLYNENGKSGKLVVFISGGYWVFGSGEESSWTVLPLVEAGHTVAVIHYDRAPKANMTKIVRQAEFGLDWIIKFAMARNLNIWLSGHSAGGQLCAMLLSSPWFEGLSRRAQETVQGVIHLSGVFDLEPIKRTSVNFDLNLSRVEVKKFSPLSTENLLRICKYKHIQHHQLVGEFDSPVFHQQAQQYRDALGVRGCVSSLTIMDHMDHFNLALNLSYSYTTSTSKFLQLLKEENTATIKSRL
eukprot:TRINITY_DN30144_c0_g1_i1.p1 TRINITY_DN30144_c0_g1~~TRINITY_DN30144_c0_g1_i1.p1  ORF type:complete len:309 (-),score=77.95 TRINITY_DN30144_c0_g1_i1:502-1401(-)